MSNDSFSAFPAVNNERKKYDPIYEICVMHDDERVIYIGRLSSFGPITTLISIKGIKAETQEEPGKKTLKKKSLAKPELKADEIKKLLEGAQPEVVYPVSSVLFIKRIA